MNFAQFKCDDIPYLTFVSKTPIIPWHLLTEFLKIVPLIPWLIDIWSAVIILSIDHLSVFVLSKFQHP